MSARNEAARANAPGDERLKNAALIDKAEEIRQNRVFLSDYP